MPKRKARTNNASNKRAGGRNRAWSSSVGTRYQKQYWINPTVGRGKNVRNDAVSSAEATACMAVALNAFSDKTTQPRFPDGKANESVGMKYQMINEIEQAQNGSIELLFFPGLNCCVNIRNCTSKSLGARNSQMNTVPVTKVQRLTNHITGSIKKGADDNGKTPLTMTQIDERSVAKWRVVSYGMLLSLVNNSEENDGWWEACRITPPNDAREYRVIHNLALSALNMGDSQPFTFFPEVPQLTSSQMLNQASYTTGKLRNIHNVIFQLNPEFEDREFVDLAEEVTLTTKTSGYSNTIGFPLDALNSPNGGTTADHTSYNGTELERQGVLSTRIQDEAVSQFLDTSFDAIFIRIHGVPQSTVRSPSRLTIHTVMNQEIVYDEKALNAKFHKGSVYHHAHERIKGTPSAGQPNKMTNFS